MSLLSPPSLPSLCNIHVSTTKAAPRHQAGRPRMFSDVQLSGKALTRLAAYLVLILGHDGCGWRSY